MRDIKLRRKLLRKQILTNALREFTPNRSQELTWELLDRLVRDLDVSSNLRDLITPIIRDRNASDYMELQKFAEPQLYSSASSYKRNISALSFLKKFPFGKVTGVDPERTAESRFYRAEKLCRLTNKRVRFFRRFGYRLDYKTRKDFHRIFHAARLKISNWLGPLDLNKIYDYTRHGPGASVGVSGDATTAYFKYMLSPYTVTPRALPYAECAILADPLWRRFVVNQCSIIGDPVPSVEDAREIVRKQLKVVDYNKVTFVPKTALTHRAIAVEPTMNIFLQLGVGDFMTDCLRRAGTNLRSQSRNQILAREGSEWSGPSQDCPVTLDLSMASDTLSTELVRDLFPDEWFHLLDSLRSHFGLYKGKRLHWEKFSSMGNGFTFQLETMIFKALTESVCDALGYNLDCVSIYGDDIICPRGVALKLVEVLSFSGFSLNAEKSFIFGPFRESCGTDWFEGFDVRPFFLRRKIQNDMDLVFVLNSLGGLYGFDSRSSRYDDGVRSRSGLFPETQAFILSSLKVTTKLHLRGPRTEALEGHIHCPWDLAQSSELVSWDSGNQCWSYVSAKPSTIYYRGRPGPIYLQMIGGCSSVENSVSASSAKSSSNWTKELALFFDSFRSERFSSFVTFRNRTKVSLATQTCHGWRND